MRIILALSCLSLALLSSCARKPLGESVKLSDIDPLAHATPVEIKEVSRSQLKQAVELNANNKPARLVQIFRSDVPASAALPQYRLFDILPNSPYEVLGLHNADVLVAANDYIIYNPAGFHQYIKLIEKEDRALIEIIRGGNPVKFEYHLVD